MKQYRLAILLLFFLVPLYAVAEIPAVKKLGKEATKQDDVEHFSAGSFMLGMAATFSNKEQRDTFKMLENIEMIECKNREYAPTLLARIMAIVQSVNARFIGSQDDGEALNELYGVMRGDTITELIIIVKSHSGDLGIVCMSGSIPEHRLADIAKIKQ